MPNTVTAKNDQGLMEPRISKNLVMSVVNARYAMMLPEISQGKSLMLMLLIVVAMLPGVYPVLVLKTNFC